MRMDKHILSYLNNKYESELVKQNEKDVKKKLKELKKIINKYKINPTKFTNICINVKETEINNQETNNYKYKVFILKRAIETLNDSNYKHTKYLCSIHSEQEIEYAHLVIYKSTNLQSKL